MIALVTWRLLLKALRDESVGGIIPTWQVKSHNAETRRGAARRPEAHL